MKTWKEVEDIKIVNYLHGNIVLAKTIYDVINSQLFSTKLLGLMLGDYPEEGEIEEGLRLSSDKEALYNIRARLSIRFAQQVVSKTNTDINQKRLAGFILEYLTYNWSWIMNSYIKFIKKKLKMFL